MIKILLHKMLIIPSFCLIFNTGFSAYNIISVEPDFGPAMGGTPVTIKFEPSDIDITLPVTVRIGNTLCTVKEASIINNRLIYLIVQTNPCNQSESSIEVSIALQSGGTIIVAKNNAFKFIEKNTGVTANNPDEYKKPVKKINKYNKGMDENTTDWLSESKNKYGKVEWDNLFDDLLINAPGDSWNDLNRYYEVTAMGIVSTAIFYSLVFNGEMPGEARWKSFSISTLSFLLYETVISLTQDTHLCMKSVVSGTAGSLAGGVVFTIYLK